MNHAKLVAYVHATLEASTARVVVELPNGQIGFVRGVTSRDGEIVIQVTTDAQEER